MHPDTGTPADLADRAVALLRGTPTDAALREARDLLERAARAVPYLDEAPHCHVYRRRMEARTCLSWEICGRCRPIRDADDED